MDISATTRLPCVPDTAFQHLADLSTYPAWLSIVRRAVAEPAGVDSVDESPAWSVDLGAKVGPVSKTKRVRMVRVVADAPSRVRFERVETDGREHSAWVLEGVTSPDGDGSLVTMSLHYGGTRWLPLLDLVLAQEVRRAGGRLADQVRRGEAKDEV